MDKYLTFEEYQDLFVEGLSKYPFMPITHGGIILMPEVDKVLEDFKTWEVREDDVWVVTYPKAGTTWTTEIVSAVMHDGNLEAIRKRHIDFRVPFFEENLPKPLRQRKNLPMTHKLTENIPSPRTLRTHLPGHLLPPQIWEKKPKIIYVIRNPKDVAVSYFYFQKMFDKEVVDQPFGEYFDKFHAGKVLCGPWWDHYLYFWMKRHEKNILLLRFEDMKRDLRGNVEKISKFLGKNLPAETLDAITDHCTFANMKKNPMANPDSVLVKGNQSSVSFMRKGKVGDWKSHFTVAQNEEFDAFVKDKLRDAGLTFDYD